jgi:error-prone DNA polymerase
MSAYVELHAHSCFSLLDAPCQPDAIVTRAAELGYTALALTDHDALYGVIRFARACREQGIQLIIGAEVTLDDGTHLTLLAEDDRGYATLARHLSTARLSQEKGATRLAWERLAEEHAGLLILTGCRQGPLAAALDAGKRLRALELAQIYAATFPDHCYVELQRHGLPGDDRRCAELAALARAVDLPVVATNDVHYLDAASWQLQDLLVCIREGITVDEPHPARCPSAAFALQAPERMARRFARYPEAVANTRRIAERCRVDLDFRSVRFPPLPHLIPPGETASSTLHRLAYEGARQRYRPVTAAVRRQLEHELALIAQLGVAEFFLICSDLATRFRGRGRGSAADSLVAYCVGITGVDPIQHRLLFERFLNTERSMPDIDIDFSVDDREAAIQYVYNTYGVEHAAMVCNYVTFQARSAVRDAGKALGLPPEMLVVLAKAIGREADQLLDTARLLADHASPEERDRLRRLAQFVPALLDLPRHLSIHNGGMVITGRPLVEIVPLENARMPDRVVLGWDKRDIEEAGLIKTDILCIRALSLIQEAVALVEEQTGVQLDLSRLPLDDPAVYRQLQTADTIGAYQVESRAQGQSLPKARPVRFEDLIAQVAIIRPGPIQGGMVHPYLRRRQGREPVRYLHPKLEPILAETLGVILYQEQVLQVATAIAGLTPGEADAFRRAMGGSRSRRAMEALREQFLAGARQQGITRQVAEPIFEQMAAFAEFGFCKSHAAALAQTAYETLWLRAYYPAAFYAALLNNQPMGFYSPEVILWDAVRHGVRFLPPDITVSAARSILENGAIRLGLRGVKHVGERAEQIVAAREGAPFASPEDAVRRAGLSPEQAQALMLVGAFDAFEPDRRKLLWRLLALPAVPPGQQRLAQVDTEPPVTLPELTTAEQTLIDYAILGFCLDRQVMELYERQRRVLRVTRADRLAQRRSGERVRVAGLVVCRQAPRTAKCFLFLTLEDEHGLINIIVRPDVREQYRQTLRHTPVLLVDGHLQQEDGITSVLAEEVRPLGAPVCGFVESSAQVLVRSHDFR